MTFRKIGLALAALGLTVTLAACSAPEEEPANAAKVAKAQTKANKHQKAQKAEKSEPTETTGQENARQSAESYLSHTAFSRSALIKQLKFEGFSKADATYAVDYLEPNWK